MSLQLPELLQLLQGGAASSAPRVKTEPWSSVNKHALIDRPAEADDDTAVRLYVTDETHSNLADLYCPRPECGAKLVGKAKAVYTQADDGPLATSTSHSTVSHAPAATAGDSCQPKEEKETSFGIIPSNSSRVEIPQKGSFWSVESALTFDNIGFTKDTDWQAEPTDKSGEMPGPTGGKRIKYLLCGACDCGPLGYTILPPSMQAGGLAQSVSDQVDAQRGQSHQATLSDQTKDSRDLLPRQEFFLAVDRVWYHFPETQ